MINRNGWLNKLFASIIAIIYAVTLSANLVAIARQRAGLSQRALAMRLGIPASTIARWELAEHAPSVETLQTVARACNLDMVVGLANLDDSYTHDVARRLTLTPTERVKALTTGAGDPLAIAAALESSEVKYVMVGEVAGATNGWPIVLGRGEYQVVPENAPRNIARLETAAKVLGGGIREIDDPYAGLDTVWRWPLLDGTNLAAAVLPAGTGGYHDLRRGAQSIALGGSTVEVASLRDLIRIADASPRPGPRAFLPALWATLEQTEAAAQPSSRAA